MADIERLMKTFYNRYDRMKKDLANMMKDVGKLFAEIEERGKLIDTLATENEKLKRRIRMLKANASKSVLRRLDAQGISLDSEKGKASREVIDG